MTVLPSFIFRPQCLERGRAGGIIGVLLAALLLAGCGESNLTAEEHIKRAQEARLNGEVQTAVLELKNALQQQPDDPRARFMLGEVYLRIGDGTSAEKEFERAVEAGMNDQSVRRPLARARLLQDSYQEVLDALSVPEKGESGRAAILALRGRAYLGLGRVDSAEAAFNEALSADAESVAGLVGLARVALTRQDTEKAARYLKKAAAIDGDALEVIRLRGDLAFQREGYAAAEKAYAELRDRRPQYLVYRMALASAQIGQEKYESAIENLDVLRKALPDHPQVNYLRGLAAYRTGAYEEAKYYMDQVLAQESDHAPALLIGGAAALALDQVEQARRNLERFTNMAPDYAPGLKLLAATQLRMGESEAARATLRPLTETPEELKDQKLLRLVASAALQSGDLESGRSYIEQLARRSPDDAELQAQLGLTRINLGEIEAGLKDLEAAVKQDPEFSRAQVALGFNQLRTGRLKEALATARKLQKSLPENSAGYVLEGLVHDRRDDVETAKASFRKALEVNPGARNAVHNLARIEVRNDRLKQARAIYEDFLGDNPEDVFALVQLAQLNIQLDEPDRVEDYLNRIVSLRPDSVLARIFLGRFYLVQGRPQESVQTVQEVLQDNQQNSGLLEVLGRAQLELGRAGEAQATFQRLADLNPNSAAAHRFLATAARANGDRETAESAVNTALSIDPDHLDALMTKARLSIRREDSSTARKVIARIDEENQELPSVLSIKGDLALLEGQPEQARKYYRQAYEKMPSSDRAIQLARVQFRQGDRDSAFLTLENWLEQSPQDPNALLRLGLLYRNGGQEEDAKATFNRLIKYHPKSWVGYNELAWQLFEEGQYDKAMPHAERARELTEEHPAALDTFGMVALKMGRNREALRSLEKAVANSNGAPIIRYHYAQALLANGDQEKARAVLRDTLRNGGDFSERAAAKELLNSIE